MSFFPPPPPAPPSAHNFPTQTYQPNSRGFRGRGNGGYRERRVRVRGGDLRRSISGQFKPVINDGGHTGHHSGAYDSSNPQYAGYGGSSNQTARLNHAATAHPPVQQPHFPHSSRNGYRMTQGYPQPARSELIDQNGPLPQSDYAYGRPAIHGEHQANGSQQSASWDARPVSAAGPPALQGPPIRIVCDPQRGGLLSDAFQTNRTAQKYPQAGEYGHPYGPNGPKGLSQTHYGPGNAFPTFRGRGQKRGHGEAFDWGGQNQGSPRIQAAPAVPIFGAPLPLPAKPPAPQGEKKRPRKKRRKYNQLGLTPKTEEHESSEEEEDDENEEARLASVVTSGASQLQLLQIHYRGRTSTLQSSLDIAAWIKERKERFPTKARAAEAAEKKRQRGEAQKAANQARKERRNNQIDEAKEKKRRQKADEETERRKADEAKEAKKGQEEPEDAANKAKRKVEKLRRQLEKEEKRIAKAEAKTLLAEDANKIGRDSRDFSAYQDGNSKKRKHSPSPCDKEVHQPSEVPASVDGHSVAAKAFTVQDGPHPAPDHLTPTSQPPNPSEGRDSLLEPSAASIALQECLIEPGYAKEDQSSISFKTLSSDLSSDSEDMTSSSGSDSSESEDAPEKTTSKRQKPEKIPPPPPKRDKPKKVCRYFLHTGRCRLGASCKFKHELPERGANTAKARESKDANTAKPEQRTERISLYQRLVEQEKKNEAETLLKAIIYLGDKGVLD